MTTQNTTNLNALFTSKATDIQRFVMDSIEKGTIAAMPTPAEVNAVFLSLPKANRDKTTYVLVFTISTLHSDKKLQLILDKAISSIADKESKSYETDKAVTKLISLVKSYIALGQDLIDTLAS